MRKLLVILLALLSLSVLASCEEMNKDADVEIISSIKEGNNYFYEIDVLKETENLESLAYTTAGEIYLGIKDDIGTKSIFLDLIFYISNEKKLTLKYQVNKNHQSLGLTLLEKINH